MSDKDKQEDLSFDEMELHGDVTIRKEKPKPQQPPRRRSSGSGFGGLSWLLLLLVLAASMSTWYFYGQYKALQAQFQQLAEERASAQRTLTTAAGSLEEANVRLADLGLALEKSKDENQSLTAKNKELDGQLAKKTADLKKNQSSLSKARSDLDKNKKQVGSLTSERNKLRREMAANEREATESINNLTTQLDEQKTRYIDAENEWNQTRGDLQSKLGKAERERDKAKKDFEDESKASMQVLRNQAQLESDKKRLEKKTASLERDLASARNRVRELENVDFGELVPYSEEITPAEVRFKEPLPDGAKVPRKLGSVALQVLITEVGAVEKAFIIPGQPVEAELARALTQSIYKWKFTPPSMGKVRVKTWQTILVRAE